MLIDTHCHINIMLKKQFDTTLSLLQIQNAQKIINESQQANVNIIINIGTSVIESLNCIELAKTYHNNFAVIGLHPNDCNANWIQDIKQIEAFLKEKKENKIVGIGECGLDYHYPDHNKQRQKDVFKAHIELSLKYNLPLVIHTREAGVEILEILETFKNESNLKGVFHCFSEDQTFANHAINDFGFLLGIGGAVTYPKNEQLRNIIKTVGLKNIILETDAPYLAPQIVRGKQNHPKYIKDIADFIATFLSVDFTEVAKTTTANAIKLFGLEV